MMRKTLWALALLFVMSGCNDGGEDTPPKYDKMVDVTFNIEYSLNYDTPSIYYPSTGVAPEPSVPSDPSGSVGQVPAMPQGKAMRFVVELWENVAAEGEEPHYIRYNQKQWGILKHSPVEGEEDRYLFTATARVTKKKYKMLIWADYINSRYVTNDGTLSSTNVGAYFGVNYVDDFDTDIRGLRCVNIPRALQRDAYDAFSGIQDVDLTPFEEFNTAATTIEASVERVFGKYTLIATDLQEYKAKFSEDEYFARRRPVNVKIDYGAEYAEAPALKDEETGELINGMRGTFDALNQNVSYYTANQTMQLPILSVSDDESEVYLTFDYAIGMPDKTPLKDVKMTIYGPGSYPITRLRIGEIPLERNKETFFRAGFFTNSWETGDGDINIEDDFDDLGDPEEIN